MCPSLSLINGTISYSDPTLGVGSVATHTCDVGYALSGNLRRTCTGMWSDSSPSCEGICMSALRLFHLNTCMHNYFTKIESNIICHDVTQPDNGTVSYSENRENSNQTRRIGTIARYSCNTGFVLVGETITTCQSDGNDSGIWSGMPPTCQGMSF